MSFKLIIVCFLSSKAQKRSYDTEQYNYLISSLEQISYFTLSLPVSLIPFRPLLSVPGAPSAPVLSTGLSSSRLVLGITRRAPLGKAGRSWIGVLEGNSCSEELTTATSVNGVSETFLELSIVSDCFSSFSFSSSLFSRVPPVLNADGDEICLSGRRFSFSSSRDLLIVPDVGSDSCLSVLERR